MYNNKQNLTTNMREEIFMYFSSFKLEIEKDVNWENVVTGKFVFKHNLKMLEKVEKRHKNVLNQIISKNNKVKTYLNHELLFNV